MQISPYAKGKNFPISNPDNNHIINIMFIFIIAVFFFIQFVCSYFPRIIGRAATASDRHEQREVIK